ncbi:hypothetical protein BMI88_03015 [Thioclava sp. F36-6]|nr:hypothetical protein BMI88_03015 [Thioclava sp. F36-6]
MSLPILSGALLCPVAAQHYALDPLDSEIGRNRHEGEENDRTPEHSEVAAVSAISPLSARAWIDVA